MGLRMLLMQTFEAVLESLVAGVILEDGEGLGGGLAAHLNMFVAPGDFGFLRSVDTVIAPVLGGAWNIAGPVIGATILVVLPEALRFSAQMREILIGIAMLAVVLFLPAGLVGLPMMSRRRVAS